MIFKLGAIVDRPKKVKYTQTRALTYQNVDGFDGTSYDMCHNFFSFGEHIHFNHFDT